MLLFYRPSTFKAAEYALAFLLETAIVVQLLLIFQLPRTYHNCLRGCRYFLTSAKEK